MNIIDFQNRIADAFEHNDTDKLVRLKNQSFEAIKGSKGKNQTFYIEAFKLLAASLLAHNLGLHKKSFKGSVSNDNNKIIHAVENAVSEAKIIKPNAPSVSLKLLESNIVKSLPNFAAKVTAIKPAGMPNIGNSCYIASSVQALTSSPRLMQKIYAPLTKKCDSKGKIETDAQFKERQEIQKALKNLIDALKNNKDSKTELFEFREAVFNNKHLNEELSVWKNGHLKQNSPLAAQHDAAELMMMLLDVVDAHVDLQEDWWVPANPALPPR